MRIRYVMFGGTAKGTQWPHEMTHVEKCVCIQKRASSVWQAGARGFCLGGGVAGVGRPQGDITRVGRHDALPMIDVEYP